MSRPYLWGDVPKTERSAVTLVARLRQRQTFFPADPPLVRCESLQPGVAAITFKFRRVEYLAQLQFNCHGRAPRPPSTASLYPPIYLPLAVQSTKTTTFNWSHQRGTV